MEPGPLERYQIGLRVAKDAMRKLGRRSIDGREAHDFAMQSVFSPYWATRRVWFDVIDAYRRERGRNPRTGCGLRRKFQRLPYSLETSDPPIENDWLRGWLLTPTEQRVAVLLSSGLTKTETARWLGVSQAAVTDAIRRIRNRNECRRTTNPRRSSSETSSSTSSTGTSDGPSSPSPSPGALGSGPS